MAAPYEFLKVFSPMATVNFSGLIKKINGAKNHSSCLQMQRLLLPKEQALSLEETFSKNSKPSCTVNFRRLNQFIWNCLKKLFYQKD